jgi:hypothetical protein
VEWWSVAAGLRRGGVDRILVPEPWSPTIEELTGTGAGGVAYAHELVTMPVGTIRRFLEAVDEVGRQSIEDLGVRCVGAFRTAMTNDHEAIVIWAFPEWEKWVEYERAWDGDQLAAWRARLVAMGADVRRTLMVDAPLAPLRIGRQPLESDRRPLDEIT